MLSTLPGLVSAGHVIDGRFPLLRQLGESEWSYAFLTTLDDGSHKRAALKIFPFESVDEHATLAQWEVARTLSHPHLMPLHHAARIDVDGEDMLYVVTDYADEALSQILPERPLTTHEAREMLNPVLSALTYLHRCCLTHGHLRPTNIMVVDDHINLSPDFGWRSRRRSIYDAPDEGIGQLAPEADIWSLGILLVEAFTQQPPSWDRSQGGEPFISPDIPEPFFTIARECLQSDPELRCSLAEIKARLSPPQAAQDIVTTQAFAHSLSHHSTKSLFKLRAMILAGAVLILLFLTAAFKFGYDLTPSDPLPEFPTHAKAQHPVQKTTSSPTQPASTASPSSTP